MDKTIYPGTKQGNKPKFPFGLTLLLIGSCLMFSFSVVNQADSNKGLMIPIVVIVHLWVEYLVVSARFFNRVEVTSRNLIIRESAFSEQTINYSDIERIEYSSMEMNTATGLLQVLTLFSSQPTRKTRRHSLIFYGKDGKYLGRLFNVEKLWKSNYDEVIKAVNERNGRVVYDGFPFRGKTG